MALPITERPLYGQIQLETSAWTSTFTWVDRTATLSGGISYSEGGRLGTPGQSIVDAGVLTATFTNAASIPAVGDAVRLRRYGTAEYLFTGFVQEVTQRIVFDNTYSVNDPITLTSIYCSDWVGYVSQFQAVGAGGYTAAGVLDPTSRYLYTSRARALNRIIDSTGATAMIDIAGGATATLNMGDTDMVGTIADHLDLIVRSTAKTMWWGTHALPTNITTGRTGLIRIEDTGTTSSGYTFRDDLGSGSNLHYVEIDFENSSQNIANTIVTNNRVRLHIEDYQKEITKIGGFNEQNFMVINNQNVVGVAVENTKKSSKATSITTYGNRQSEFDTNLSANFAYWNFVANPSAEYSDDGYTGNTNARVRRRKPSAEATPFTPPVVDITGAPAGEWAIRSRQTTAASSARIVFIGGETDGTPVVPTTGYQFSAFVARGAVSQTNTRAYLRIDWMNDSETTISSSTGPTTALTASNTWYRLASGFFAAPAGASRAQLYIFFERSSGSIQVADILWADALAFQDIDATYWDGDVPRSGSTLCGWAGGTGSSPSYFASDFTTNLNNLWLDQSATTSMRVTRIRWNAQENLAAVSALTVGKTISVIHDGTTTTHRIVGIEGNIDPDRYMIDYYLTKI
jgi:hypothetical protein